MTSKPAQTWLVVTYDHTVLLLVQIYILHLLNTHF